MNKQTIEKIKKESKRKDKALKKELLTDVIIMIKNIVFWGGVLLSWTFTILLVIIIIENPQEGVLVFLNVNSKLYQLYAILVGVRLFIFGLEYVSKYRNKRVDIIEIKK